VEGVPVPKLRVHNFSVSVDGYAAGPDQSLDNPLGVGGEELHNWLVVTRTFRKMSGEEGGDEVRDSLALWHGHIEKRRDHRHQEIGAAHHCHVGSSGEYGQL
jgi:hypothetical protein